MSAIKSTTPMRFHLLATIGDGEPVEVAEFLCRVPLAFKPLKGCDVIDLDLGGRIKDGAEAFVAAFEQD